MITALSLLIISFKEEIDLTDYLSYIEKKYVLYCIIVHSGSKDNGHYFCIVKYFKYNCYIKFNDSSVYIPNKKEVFNEIFGGEKIEYILKNISNNKDCPKYEVKKKKNFYQKMHIYLFM